MARTALQKKEAMESALCAAFGCAGTVMVLEFFRIPNCYMSLSFASTLSLLPTPSSTQVVTRLIALTFGIACSMLVVIGLPEAPWFSIPLVGVIPALGYSYFCKRSGPGSAYAFSAYFLALYVTAHAELLSGNLILQSLKLWAQSVVPIVITYLASLIIKEKKAITALPKKSLSSIISIGLTVSIATIFDATIKTDQAARLVMASIAGIATLEIDKSTNLFGERTVGYAIGVVVATGFIVAAVAVGNDIAVYLLMLGGIFGFLEWVSCRFPNQATIYRAVAAMLAYSIFMTPYPDRTFDVAFNRISNSLIGFLIALLVFLIVKKCEQITKHFAVPNVKTPLSQEQPPN